MALIRLIMLTVLVLSSSGYASYAQQAPPREEPCCGSEGK